MQTRQPSFQALVTAHAINFDALVELFDRLVMLLLYLLWGFITRTPEQGIDCVARVCVLFSNILPETLSLVYLILFVDHWAEPEPPEHRRA